MSFLSGNQFEKIVIYEVNGFVGGSKNGSS